MTILIDIDSTITNFGEALLKNLNEYNGTSYDYSEVDSYDWFDDHFSDPFYILQFEGFWDEVHVNPKAVEAIESWIDKGYKVYLVSASGFHDALGYKIRKTLSAFNKLDESNIIIARDKNMVKGDILIDDCIDNLEKFDEAKICYAQPWNKEWTYTNGHGGLRESNWTAIDEIVDALYDTYFKNM